MFCLFQLDPASYKDGFPNPDHVWTSFQVLVFLKAQVYWKDYDTPFSCFHASRAVHIYVYRYLQIVFSFILQLNTIQCYI